MDGKQITTYQCQAKHRCQTTNLDKVDLKTEMSAKKRTSKSRDGLIASSLKLSHSVIYLRVWVDVFNLFAWQG